ncbi:MAG TPA: CHAD domain-containing protein, partial [Anaerolineales bacterium]|nr:CHAD domain-containing protein [Anaerolineales bacterium]
TRRLLAAMDILRALDPHPRIQKTRRVLKNQLDSLDDLRNVQVMLADISVAAANFPELESFESHLVAREKKLLRKAHKALNRFQVSDLKKQIGRTRTSLEEKAQAQGFSEHLLPELDKAYSKAMQAFGQMDASQPASIHRLRIAFKKFRYMVEIANPILAAYPEANLRQMHEYQSKMGDVQDAEVFLQALADFAKQSASAITLEPARAFFELQLKEMINAFMTGKDVINRFWRSAPDQPFPWEN